jgi:hypothetical protein
MHHIVKIQGGEEFDLSNKRWNDDVEQAKDQSNNQENCKERGKAIGHPSLPEPDPFELVGYRVRQ